MIKRFCILMMSLCLSTTLLTIDICASDDEAALDAQAKYQTEADGIWNYGSVGEALEKVYDGGRVEVLQDVELDKALIVTKDITLTGGDPDHPAVLTYQGKTRSDFLLSIQGADVVMENIILDGGHSAGKTSRAELLALKGGGSVIMNAGTVLQNNYNVDTSLSAGGLRVINGSVTMNTDSIIRNCAANGGGGAATAGVNAKLILKGGRIENCQAILGGGVFVTAQGSLMINSGTIQNNQAKKAIEGFTFNFNYVKGQGGGIYVDSGYTYMFGGSISDNRAESSGGGIGVDTGVVQLAGGSVSNNYAQMYGGGVTASPTANILVGMAPVISDNIGGEKYFDNLYLDGVEDEVPAYATRPIIIGTDLAEGAEIHVSRWTRPDEDHPYRIIAVPAKNYEISQADLARFVSDDPAYIVLLIDGNIVLTAKPPHEHEWEEEWNYDDQAHWHNCSVSDCPITDNTLKDGYGLHREDNGTVSVEATEESEGIMVYRCTVCHHILRTEVIPKLPVENKWAEEWTFDEHAHWHNCVNCEISDNTLKDGYGPHIEDNGTISIEATKESEGIKIYRCLVCHCVLRTEIIPKLPADTILKDPDLLPAPVKPSNPSVANEHTEKAEVRNEKSNQDEKTPNTGDASRIHLYMTLMVMTAAIGGAWFLYGFYTKKAANIDRSYH